MALASPILFPFPEHLNDALVQPSQIDQDQSQRLDESQSQRLDESQSQMADQGQVQTPPNTPEPVRPVQLPTPYTVVSDETKLKTLLSGVVDLFRMTRQQPVTPNEVAETNLPPSPPSPPSPPLPSQRPYISSEAKLKTLLSSVFDVFKKRDVVTPQLRAQAPAEEQVPSLATDSETKIKLILDTVYRLFERRLAPTKEVMAPQIESEEVGAEDTEVEEKQKKEEEHYKPPKVVYEPDMNSEECLKYLEPTLHEFYEPMTTYIDEDLRQGTCVYKLKDRNMADGAKEKTIHRTYPLQAA